MQPPTETSLFHHSQAYHSHVTPPDEMTSVLPLVQLAKCNLVLPHFPAIKKYQEGAAASDPEGSRLNLVVLCSDYQGGGFH